jgi:hypothetical protein
MKMNAAGKVGMCIAVIVEAAAQHAIGWTWQLPVALLAAVFALEYLARSFIAADLRTEYITVTKDELDVIRSLRQHGL